MTTEHEQRRADRLAADWRYDAGLEQQAELHRDNPAEHDRIFGGRGQIALGLYLDDKAAAQAAGLDTSGPPPQPEPAPRDPFADIRNDLDLQEN